MSRLAILEARVALALRNTHSRYIMTEILRGAWDWRDEMKEEIEAAERDIEAYEKEKRT